MKPEEQDTWIDKYLRGGMTEEELQAFEQQLEEDDSLRQRVEAMKEIKEGIRQSVLNEKRKMMEMWDEELDSEQDTEDFNQSSSAKATEDKESTKEKTDEEKKKK